MPERKHNMFAIKLIGLGVSIISVTIGIFTVPWASVIQFGHSMKFVYEHAADMEHIVDDYHELLPLRDELDSVKRVLFETKNRDSLISVISHLNRGKFPYDSIWVKGPSGVWYMTTMEKHFTEDHE